MTGGDKTNDNGKKMIVDNGQKKNENMVTQNGQNKHSPKTKDDVRYMEGKMAIIPKKSKKRWWKIMAKRRIKIW